MYVARVRHSNAVDPSSDNVLGASQLSDQTGGAHAAKDWMDIVVEAERLGQRPQRALHR